MITALNKLIVINLNKKIKNKFNTEQNISVLRF